MLPLHTRRWGPPGPEAVAVPNGHNVLWESPVETFAAIEGFLARDAATAA